MIDLHNHLLPGLDDGARDMDEALAMARLAVADGITHLVCTPHIRPGRYDNTREGIEAALVDYRAALAAAGIGIAVAAAAEVHFGLEVMTEVRAGRLPLLGRWDDEPVLLLEFPHSHLPVGAEQLTRWLRDQGIRPMIAHPERNRDLVRDAARLEPFLAQGCLIQLTAGAVTGQFGEHAAARAMQLIEAGEATCLASDAHNTDNRMPGLARAAAWVSEAVDAATAQRLVCDNPWRIVAGQFAA